MNEINQESLLENALNTNKIRDEKISSLIQGFEARLETTLQGENNELNRNGIKGFVNATIKWKSFFEGLSEENKNDKMYLERGISLRCIDDFLSGKEYDKSQLKKALLLQRDSVLGIIYGFNIGDIYQFISQCIKNFC